MSADKIINNELLNTILSLPGDVIPLPLSEEEQSRFTYFVLTEEEHDYEVLQQLRRIKSDNKVVGTPERTMVWEDGWGDNLIDLKKTKNLASLMPKYFRKDQPFRLFSRFIHTDNYKFDFELRAVILRNYFKFYLEEYSDIYEFGCGTGINLLELSKMWPNKQLHGCDLTNSSKQIIEILHDEFGIQIDGKQFNFVEPDRNYHLKQDSAVFTVAALEQIGDQWSGFLDYLLIEKPAIVLHLEPIEELYKDDNLVDYLALEFHRKRKYLSGYYTRLKELEAEGKIEILDSHRTYVGNLNDESYSLIVWRPLVGDN